MANEAGVNVDVQDDDDFYESFQKIDIDIVVCPHCRTRHSNVVGLRLFISHECPLCCNDSPINYSLPCGHVYCPVCFVNIGGIVHVSDVAPAAASASRAVPVASATLEAAGRTRIFPHHSEMTYEKNKGRQLTHADKRNKKQTYDRQLKLMKMLVEGKLDNNGLKDILFYIDEMEEIPSSLKETIGMDSSGGYFRKRFDNHYKIYLCTHVKFTFLSPLHDMYDACKNSNSMYNNNVEKLYKSLSHLDWKDTLSDLLYRYNNKCYSDVSTVHMVMDQKLKYYCMKGHHFVKKTSYWMYINPLYKYRCKDCVECVPNEPTHLL